MADKVQLLGEARMAVEQMWRDCANLSDIRMASAEDTIHFLHEEASEVVKCAMHMGLMGDKTYYRSDEARSTKWNWGRLLGEVGDVLLMALTLAVAFDVDPSVCLQLSLDKFYDRAEAQTQSKIRCPHPASVGHAFRSSRGSFVDFCADCGIHRNYHAKSLRTSIPQEETGAQLPCAEHLRVGLSIIESDALARARNCTGFVDDGRDYCTRCRVRRDLHTIDGRVSYVYSRVGWPAGVEPRTADEDG